MSAWKYLFVAVSFFTLPLMRISSPSAFAQGPPPVRPNVLFLFSDDQRADTIAALGNAHIQTPYLDRLVREGTTLTQAYCMGAQQGAVCVPSRAMLMTGRTLFRAKTDLQGQTTWPETFARAGYTTFITGKWHNGAPSALRTFAEGKAVFLGGMGDPYSLPIQDITAERQFTKPRPSQNIRSNSSPTAPSSFSRARGATSHSSVTWRSTRRTILGSRPRSTTSTITRRSRRCRPTSCRSTRSTSATTWPAGTSGWPPGRGPRPLSVSTWPTITLPSRSWTPRWAASSKRSMSTASTRKPSSFSAATMDWPLAATGCSASRTCTSTRCTRP